MQVRQIRLAAPDCKSGTIGFTGSNPVTCTIAPPLYIFMRSSSVVELLTVNQ
jgi:hypothetical protein